MMTDFGSLIFYYFIYLTATLLFSQYRSGNSLVRKIGPACSVILLTLMSGFRYNVGTDYSNYYYIFQRVKYTDWGSLTNGIAGYNGETNFLLFSKIFLQVLSVKQYFGVLSLITIGIVTIVLVKQYSSEEYDTTLVYFLYLFIFFSESLTNIRQYLALSVLMIGYKYIFKNQFWRYLIIVLIAMFFHISAIVALPIYFFWNHKSGQEIKKIYFVIPIIAAVWFILNWRQVISFLVSHGIFSEGRMAIYQSTSATNNYTFFVKAILLILFAFFFKYLNDDRDVKLYIYLFAIGTVLSGIGFFVGHLKRLGLYYEIPCIFIIPALSRFFVPERSRNVYKAIVVILTMAYFCLLYYVLKNSYMIPYQWK